MALGVGRGGAEAAEAAFAHAECGALQGVLVDEFELVLIAVVDVVLVQSERFVHGQLLGHQNCDVLLVGCAVVGVTKMFKKVSFC